MRALLSGGSFAAGVTLFFVCASAVSVYFLGHVERGKGPDFTFQILAWLAPAVAAVATVAYVLGALKSSFWPQWWAALAAGALVSALVWFLGWAVAVNTVTAILVWLAGLAGAFFSPVLLRPRKA